MGRERCVPDGERTWCPPRRRWCGQRSRHPEGEGSNRQLRPKSSPGGPVQDTGTVYSPQAWSRSATAIECWVGGQQQCGARLMLDLFWRLCSSAAVRRAWTQHASPQDTRHVQSLRRDGMNCLCRVAHWFRYHPSPFGKHPGTHPRVSVRVRMHVHAATPGCREERRLIHAEPYPRMCRLESPGADRRHPGVDVSEAWFGLGESPSSSTKRVENRFPTAGCGWGSPSRIVGAAPDDATRIVRRRISRVA